MPYSVTFRLTGSAETQAALSAVEQAWSDLREPWREIEKDAWRVFARRFREQGPGWTPLSRAYAAWKQEHFPGKPILERTGALVSQMTGDSGWWSEVGPQQATFGVSLDYFAAHQYGAPARHVPARRIVDFTPTDIDQFAGRVHSYLVRSAQARGFRVTGGGLP